MPRRGRGVRRERSRIVETSEEEREEEEEEEEEEISVDEGDVDGADPMRFNVLLRDPGHRDNWGRLSSLDVHVTRYLCNEATDALGIKADVNVLLDRIGWREGVSGGWKTYPVLTREFLSTFTVKRTKKKDPVSCKFRLGNVNRELSADKLCTIFKAPLEGIFNPPNSYNCSAFWRAIIIPETNSEAFNPSAAKASEIRNPVFRYLHRVLASTIFARKEIGGLRLKELFLLWSMLTGVNVNFGAHLMEQFFRQAGQISGAICIGGMITPIAEHFEIDLSSYTALRGARTLNLTHLRICRMIGPTPSPFWFLQKDGCHFPLPNMPLTTITHMENRANWLMNTERHLDVIKGSGGSLGPLLLSDDQSDDENIGTSAQGARRGRRSREDVGKERWSSMESMLGSFNASLTGMRNDMTSQFSDLRNDMDSRFMAMGADMNNMREDYTSLRSEVAGARSDVHELTSIMRQWTGASSQSQQPPSTPSQQLTPYDPYQYPAYPYPPSYPPYPYPPYYPRPPPSV